jgi:hypothetical protein
VMVDRGFVIITWEPCGVAKLRHQGSCSEVKRVQSMYCRVRVVHATLPGGVQFNTAVLPHKATDLGRKATKRVAEPLPGAHNRPPYCVAAAE